MVFMDGFRLLKGVQTFTYDLKKVMHPGPDSRDASLSFHSVNSRELPARGNKDLISAWGGLPLIHVRKEQDMRMWRSELSVAGQEVSFRAFFTHFFPQTLVQRKEATLPPHPPSLPSSLLPSLPPTPSFLPSCSCLCSMLGHHMLVGHSSALWKQWG